MSTRANRTRPAARKPSEDIFDLIGKSENLREASAAMQAMAHPLRLKILCLVGGIVLRQNPQAGFQIAPGEPISLEVSR